MFDQSEDTEIQAVFLHVLQSSHLLLVTVCQESVESANTTIEDEDVKGKNISCCSG